MSDTQQISLPVPTPSEMRISVLTAQGHEFRSEWEPWSAEERQKIDNQMASLSDESRKLALVLKPGRTMYFNRRHVIGVAVDER